MKNLLLAAALAALLPVIAFAQSTTATTTPSSSTTPPGSTGGSTSSSSSSTTTPPAKPAKAPKNGKIPYKGTVSAIDTKTNTLTVSTSTKDPSKTLVLILNSSTTYKKDGGTGAETDITVGETVTGSYTKDASGTLTAASVHLKTSK